MVHDIISIMRSKELLGKCQGSGITSMRTPITTSMEVIYISLYAVHRMRLII